MKTTIPLTAIFLILGLTLQISCKKDSPTQAQNQSPLIVSLTANPTSLDWGGTSELIVIGTDPDGQDITTSWQATGGAFLTNTNSDTVTWQAPDSSGSFDCIVTLSDGEDAASERITITVSEHPLLSTDKDSLVFDTNTSSSSFNISNIGTGILDWTTTSETDDGSNWITNVDPTAGALPTNNSETISVEVDRTGLAGNQYFGWINVTTDDGDKSLRVIMAVAELAVSEQSLDFGTTSTSENIEIQNVGAGSLSWSINENISWLSVSPLSGTVTAQQTVTITVDRTGLAAGLYSESFEIQSDGGNETVSVNLEVEEVQSVTGDWRGVIPGLGIDISITESLDGSVDGDGLIVIVVDGAILVFGVSVSGSRQEQEISLIITSPAINTLTFSGTINDDVTMMTGRLTTTTGLDIDFTFSREDNLQQTSLLSMTDMLKQITHDNIVDFEKIVATEQ